MFGVLYKQMQILFAEKINKFIYTLRKIPFIGKSFQEDLYARVSLKKFLAVIVAIYTFLSDFCCKLIYFCFVIYVGMLPMLLADGEKVLNYINDYLSVYAYWIIFFMNMLLGSFANSQICACDENDYFFVGLLRLNAKRYYLTKMFKAHILQTIYFTIFMCVLQVVFFNSSIIDVLLFMAVYFSFRFIGEAVKLYLNDKIGIPFNEKNKIAGFIYSIYIAAIIIIAYLPTCLKCILKITYALLDKKDNVNMYVFDINIVLTNPVFIILSIAAAVISIKYLFGYNKYLFLAKRFSGYNEVTEQRELVNSVSNAKKVVELEDLSEEDYGKRIFEDRHGYEYLNAIFFERNKKLFLKPVLRKTFVVAFVMAAAAAGIFIYRCLASAGEFNKFADTSWSLVGEVLGVLVFIMYLTSSGNNITKSMFYNCDYSLLKYGYYRTKDAIIQNFKIRLRFMIKNEISMVTAFAVGLLINTLLLGKIDQWSKLLSIILCISFLSIFYDIVYLCMYYIFQPYTEGGKETGIGYFVCKSCIYILSYSCLSIDIIPQYFAMIVIGVVVVTLLVAFILVYMIAPKRFVLK